MPDTLLVGRQRELEALERTARSGRGELAVVWGRRRVGKTFLLQAFVERHPTAILYGATEQSREVELAAFTDHVRAATGGEGLPLGYAFPSWDAALSFLTERAGTRRLVVILDEFPYLARSSPGLESVVQRWWDRGGRSSGVMLILCGSDLPYMRAMTAGQAALHQRATLVLRVDPLGYESVPDFLPGAPLEECARVYGMLGGTPLYLRMWDPSSSLTDNATRLFGNPTSPLIDAAELALSRDAPGIEGSFRILQAIATGRTRPSTIRDYAKVAVERPLRRLIAIEMVERRVPVTEDPGTTRRAIYTISDPYYRFWFRFIGPAREQIARGLGGPLIRSRVLPLLDDHMGPVFESMARRHAHGLVGSGRLTATRIGPWWSADSQHEVDVVGTTDGSIGFVGSVKWSSAPLGVAALRDLDRHAAAVPGITPGTVRLLYGRGGVQPDVARGDSVLGFSLRDLYPGTPGRGPRRRRA